MESYLEKIINNYKTQESEINQLKDTIKQIEREQIQPLEFAIEDKRKQLNTIGEDTIIDIRFGDLVEEISELTGVSINDMVADINFYGTSDCWTLANWDKEDFVRANPIQQFTVILSSETDRNNCQGMDFNYHLNFLSDLNELQADGRKLIEYCYVRRFYDDLRCRKINDLCTNPKDIMNIVCHLKLRDLARSYEWNDYYPKDLLGQAIVNHQNKQNKKSLEKIRKMVI